MTSDESNYPHEIYIGIVMQKYLVRFKRLNKLHVEKAIKLFEGFHGIFIFLDIAVRLFMMPKITRNSMELRVEEYSL